VSENLHIPLLWQSSQIEPFFCHYKTNQKSRYFFSKILDQYERLALNFFYRNYLIFPTLFAPFLFSVGCTLSRYTFGLDRIFGLAGYPNFLQCPISGQILESRPNSEKCSSLSTIQQETCFNENIYKNQTFL